MSEDSALSPFHPVVRRWFAERFGSATEVQRLAWPQVADGHHVLVTAPTGSGKTLTAFLWALDGLFTGRWPPGQVRVLYVSPLKALNTDIERNLTVPLRELQEAFVVAGEAVPTVRVQTRSGDTPGDQRRRMVRHPPEILITTPESLNILLTSRSGRGLLSGVATVILDEIHAVAGSKRGTHLISAVDRLVGLCGEFQRIGISATVRPLERIAEFLGGYRLDGPPEEPRLLPRPVRLVRSAGGKEYRLRVCAPATLPEDDDRDAVDTFWRVLAGEFRNLARINRSTLFFANSRRITEKVTRTINEDQPRELAYSHHGSLSRELRTVVEERLKRGELAAIVATNSLELGIDVGELDEVVLIQTPPTIASAIQRVGRAGHGVGQVSSGRFFPTHGRDFLDAAVMVRAILEQDIEEVTPVECPLDVLAQVILSMVAAEPWRIDDLHLQLRTSYPYRNLKRRQLELVLEMLAGRYAESRIRELEPRVSIDRVDGTVRARGSAARLVYLAGGTIPDRGYFHLRLLDGGGKLGELDEEFVWERSVGDTFNLGAQSWRIEKITHNDVLVTPAVGAASLAPFWRADERDRSFHLSERIGRFLAAAAPRLEGDELTAELVSEHHLEPAAAAELVELLRRQRAACDGRLPHRHHLVVERYQDPHAAVRRQILLHTFWGGQVNRPFALALAAAWEERYPEPLQVVQDDDCINLILPESFELKDVFSLVREGELETLLRRRLETTGFFGARFRENAGRALLLPRRSFRRRMPLWLSRLRSKKLLETVVRYEDFPVVLETWRSCLQDHFDLPRLQQLLRELREGEITVSEAYTQTPSPFAANIVWKQTNQAMYEDDTPEIGKESRLRVDLIRELVFSSHLRPRLAPELVGRFEAKLQRLQPGYAPTSGEELLDWIRERLLIPLGEWHLLLEASERDGGGPPELAALASRAAIVSVPGGEPGVCSLEVLPRLAAALGTEVGELALASLEEPEAPLPAVAAEALAALPATFEVTDAAAEESGPAVELTAEWLRFYGPLSRERWQRLWGWSEAAATSLLETLVEQRRVVVDELTAPPAGGSPEPLEICDSENLEILLRQARSAARPRLEALPARRLSLFLAQQQGLTEPGATLDELQRRMEKLLGYPAPAEAWESDLLPARMAPYFPSWLDMSMQESSLAWVGCGPRRLTFAFEEDLELFFGAPEDVAPAADPATDPSPTVLPDQRGRFSFQDLLEHNGLSAAQLADRLWERAWEGRVSNDTFLAVRRGLESRFKAPAASPSRRPSRRTPVRRWRGERSSLGNWYAVEVRREAQDALDEEELNKDRARQLLERYGVVFRQLVARELPLLQWSRLFRSLRLMELSGEIVAGSFFCGVPGLQFASHEALRRLREPLPDDAVYWLNAADPASACGVDVPELKELLPARRSSTFIAFEGDRPRLVAERHGRRLDIRVPPDHPRLAVFLGVLKVLLGREVRPLRGIEVETINGERAADSPYAPVLRELFEVTREPDSLKLRRRYRP